MLVMGRAGHHVSCWPRCRACRCHNRITLIMSCRAGKYIGVAVTESTGNEPYDGQRTSVYGTAKKKPTLWPVPYQHCGEGKRLRDESL